MHLPHHLSPKTHNLAAELHAFSSKERDAETGLSYFGARYYSSDLSIWLSVDPMVDKYPSLSPYVYCANNPVKLVDPNGEEVSNPDDPPKRNLIQKIEDGIVKLDKSLEGHSDGANQAKDVPEKAQKYVQAIAVNFPVISQVNDAKTLVKGEDIYENKANTTDKAVAVVSLITAGTAKVVAKVTTKSLKPISKAVSTITSGVSKIYTSIKILQGKSKNENKK